MGKNIIEIDNVSKQYRLGVLGGGSLRSDLQSWWARIRGKEDPNAKLGQELTGQRGSRFFALKDVSFNVEEGEALGIIGRNGAGKSTLLKLISRVTAPTFGEIRLNGRVASMLEVGTGFHGELTGRENVFMNGAILGMTKAETAKKMDDIIDFSECGAFIDTPVKRYSSGMYVKLAFSVAAHLNSEIMIMDEVLAVGDVNFQNKCINKMKSVIKEEGKTILYVSHNMATIRSLCNRTVVLQKGQKIFEGDVEEGIKYYISNNDTIETYNSLDLDRLERPKFRSVMGTARMLSVDILSDNDNVFEFGSKTKLKLKWSAEDSVKEMNFRINLSNAEETIIGVMYSDKPLYNNGGINETILELDLSNVIPGKYSTEFTLCKEDNEGHSENLDVVRGVDFVIENGGQLFNKKWPKAFGNILLPAMKVKTND